MLVHFKRMGTFRRHNAQGIRGCSPVPVIAKSRKKALACIAASFLLAIAAGREAHSGQDITTMMVGGKSFRVKLIYADNFADMQNWRVETNGSVTATGGELIWNCRGKHKAGTLWCTRLFEGPTIVEYDVVPVEGANNINFIFYGQSDADLLETSARRTGAYGEYHTFQNYIITFLTDNSRWRVRFRKNPGFHLMSEIFTDAPVDQGKWTHMMYCFEKDGSMSMYVNNILLHSHKDAESVYRKGYHGFRTWNSVLRYSGFKVYSIAD